MKQKQDSKLFNRRCSTTVLPVYFPAYIPPQARLVYFRKNYYNIINKKSGTNEYLANKYNICIPDWVYKDFHYINKRPYFRLPNNIIANIIFYPEKFRLRSVFILERDMVGV
jgi:hypothetical protein